MSGKWLARAALTSLVAVCAPACASGPEPLRLHDASGALREPFADAACRRALVLLFVDPECPISNAYAPEVKRLAAEFGPRGVELELVYSAPGLDPQAVRRHVADFGYELPALLDSDQRLAARAGATVTPEAVVFLPDGELVYRGRIDDRFVDFGRQRPQPTQRELRDALEALLAGRAPPVPRTESVGCPIPRARASD